KVTVAVEVAVAEESVSSLPLPLPLSLSDRRPISVTVPPSGIACSAFSIRLSRACSNRSRSRSTGGRSGSGNHLISTFRWRAVGVGRQGAAGVLDRVEGPAGECGEFADLRGGGRGGRRPARGRGRRRIGERGVRHGKPLRADTASVGTAAAQVAAGGFWSGSG